MEGSKRVRFELEGGDVLRAGELSMWSRMAATYLSNAKGGEAQGEAPREHG